MNWLIVSTFVLGTILISLLIWVRTREALKRVSAHRQRIELELGLKKSVLGDLAQASLCYLSNEKIHDLSEMVKKSGERLDVTRTQHRVAQAEYETLKERIDEITALEDELEHSNAEAERELANLHAQEDKLKNRLAELQNKLDSTTGQISQLLKELSSNEAVVKSLEQTNKQLLSAQKDIVDRQETISRINLKYFELKRAYDSLDIEYAQLYERQSSR